MSNNYNNNDIDKNKEILDKLYDLVKNDQKLSSMNKTKALSSIITLKQFNLIKEAYFDFENCQPNELLIHLFGLFQGLFVAIDGCYSISLALTKTKWSVNINLNPVLHEIKFVRNDVVGHPSNRTYGNKAIGFSFIDYEKTNFYNLVYQTHIYKSEKKEIEYRNINIKDTVYNYYLEVNKLLNDVINKTYLPKTSLINYSSLVNDLYLNYKLGKVDILKKIDDLKNVYLKDNCLPNNTLDRFIWRLNILSSLISFPNENLLITEIINYSVDFQLKKIYNMAKELDEMRKIIITEINFSDIMYPNILKIFKNLKKKNMKLFSNLHDSMHPDFKNNLIELKSKTKSIEVKEVIDFILELDFKKYSNIIYAIGSAIKA